MAFRKAIGAETLDLPEAALGEITLVATRNHALGELGAELLHLSLALEGAHGAAELVGPGLAEPGGGDGELHRLFLEKRHAEGLVQDAPQLLGGIGHVLRVGAAVQIGMHHVALDRAGPHDRHLDHQVVELPGAQARQHVHLRPAFHLEDADGIRPG
ncbi:hypothetical protein ROTAS13_04578 [Roseomonas sp. TAS13]|nr:hypothetical protein ROTAS13_04578 [Roseomonas sp. TAS13]